MRATALNVRLCLAATFALALSIILGLLATTAKATPDFLYFSQEGSSINRVNQLDLADLSVAPLVSSGSTGPFGVAVDTAGHQLYWTDTDSDSILRRSLDGTGPIETLISSLSDPHDIELDLVSGVMYFADRMNGALKRADLSGANVDVVLNAGLPTYIELDLVHGKIYFVHDSSGAISRANLDGSGEELLVSGLGVVSGIAINPLADSLFFALRDDREIYNSRLDGTEIVSVVTGLEDRPLDLAIDLEGGVLYWSQFDGIKSFASGGSVQTLVSGLQGSSGTSGVNGIALDQAAPIPEPSTALLVGTGLFGLGFLRRRAGTSRF